MRTKVATSEDVTLEDFPTSLLNQLTRRGLDTKLRNMVYYWLKEKCSSFKYFPLEPLDYMKKCQMLPAITTSSEDCQVSSINSWMRTNMYKPLVLVESWESRVWKSVVSMSHHLGIPLARGRLSSEQESVEENWSEFSQWEIDLSRCKPVYSPKDFLDCILQIVSPNYQLNGIKRLLLLFSFDLLHQVVVTVQALFRKCLFGDLTTGDPHFGLNRCNEGELDPNGSYSRNGAPKLIYAQRVRLAETIINRGLAPVAQEFLKKGCPPSLRSKIWQLILGSYVTQEHMEYYSELKQAVIKSDLIIDRLILKVASKGLIEILFNFPISSLRENERILFDDVLQDVQLTAANDDQYFVFEDSLYQVLLCFTRDVTLLDLFDRSSKNPLTAQVKGKGKHVDTSVIYPPNGIVPFHGFTMYVAPLCYLYDDAETLFFTFRSLYTRYWYRLHEISSHEDGIIGLSILFEKLLHRHETQLWFHLRSLRVLPLRVVFKWLMKGFSGYLPAEQVLQLWDLLLAYNTIQILPLFAMGVLSIRKENLMKAQLPQTVDAVLADLSSIRVLPVLQLALSKETF
ncbi:TBC1 domain family member 19 [Orchesella cincta]|uniref:TBC1 domain family member 19 n=1 Tax=Orchesella cincta TaxID=48709 RepID=A0A1D2NGD6_ORCCI|nr:TBC1 domain family member 19 [Orchesella cincta]